MRRYPAYRDSGVDWLGEVPEGWEVVPLKRIASLQSGDTITSERIEVEGAFPVYGGNGLRGYTDGYTHEGEFVLIGRQGALCGNVNYANERFWASEHAIVVSERKPFAVRWLGEVLRTMNLGQYSTSAAQPGIAVEAIRELFIPLPPLTEQTAIAAFLDRETAKIDALVGEQRRLIALLREKRQAVISHAVTRGLNPNAALKPSGIDWLGDVPEGWEVVQVKFQVRSIEQGWSPQCDGFPATEGEWGVLKVGCVNGGDFRPSENKALPADLAQRPELTLQSGDILVSRANTRELVGSAAVVPYDFPELMLCDKLYRLRVRSGVVEPEYLSLNLSTPHARFLIELEASGASSSMLNIPQSAILNMKLPVPPHVEQQEIIGFVNSTKQTFDSLITTAESAIALLQERRAALISAAVTGKIDVRHLTDTATEAA